MKSIKSERIAIFKKIYPLMRSNKGLYFLLGVFKAFFLILSLISPVFYLMLINDVMIKKRIINLVWVIGGYIGIYLLETLGISLNKIVYNKFYSKFRLKLRKQLLHKYMQMDIKEYLKYDSGDLKNRIEDDVNAIEKFLNSNCIDYIYTILSALLIGVILLYMNWMLSLFGFLMVPLSFLFAKIMGKKAGKASNSYREQYGKYESFLHATIQNCKEIKTNNLENKEDTFMSQYWDKLSPLFIKQHKYRFINRTFIAFKDLFVTKMNLYFVGGVLIIHNRLDVAVLLVFMNYYEQFFGNISTIADLIIGFKIDKPSINRVMEILGHSESNKLQIYNLADCIEVENVSFTYPNTDKLVLKDVNFNIDSREHIAIVGRSGCGKTTLTKLLSGLYNPDHGAIFIGGYDIQKISSDSIGRKIGVVMQEPMLFNLTVRENLLLAKKRATQDELDNACRQANVFDFIQEMPNKYETIIGEGGIKLSGGQKQRLAIARTILFNPDIIIFDEATSSLDHESEKAILTSIKNLAKGKSIITVAHRLSSVLDADRVIVIDIGEIVAIGKHEDLKNSNEIYELLFKKQYQMMG